VSKVSSVGTNISSDQHWLFGTRVTVKRQYENRSL
jgi:hypothetical protein